MNGENEKKDSGKVREKKKKVLKVGGLWVDSLSFPRLTKKKTLTRNPEHRHRPVDLAGEFRAGEFR